MAKMTLIEAIKHCEEEAKELREQPFKEKMSIEDIAECEECAEEHEQLAEWLKELKAYKETSQGEWIRLDLAKRVIAKFEGYLDEDMIYRIQLALEKENDAEMQKVVRK